MCECVCMNDYAYEYTHSQKLVLIGNSDVKMLTASLFQIFPIGEIILKCGSNAAQLHLGKIWMCEECTNEMMTM